MGPGESNQMVFPLLLLRKPPSASGIRASALKPIIARRVDVYDRGDLQSLVREYEADVVAARAVEKRSKTGNEKESARVRKVCDLLSRFQCNKARKQVTSNGLEDINNDRIVQQMRRKHPHRKKEITPATEEELSAARKGIGKKTLREVLHGLSHDTSPGLGSERNEHLTVLLFDEQSEVTSRAQSAFDNMFEFANDVVQVNLPGYFYRAWVANRLVPANKVHPFELPEGAEPDCMPIQIGRSDRRLFSRAYWDESLQFEYNRILGPVQNGVGIKGEISITAMGVQAGCP